MKIDKKILKKVILFFSLILIIAIIGIVILKYNTEGEINMPFKISKIMVVSTAEGTDKNTEIKWDLDIVQVNDIYIEIEKNKNYPSIEIIDKIKIDNLKIEKLPQKGKINLYKTSVQKRDVYNEKETYLIEKSIEYIGAEKTDNENLTIANQGGLITLKAVNENLGNYQSDYEEEVKHDGTMLKNIGINSVEEIKTKLSFDITLILKSDIIYKGNITLELPVGNIIEEGISHIEKTDLKDIIFKRQ